MLKEVFVILLICASLILAGIKRNDQIFMKKFKDYVYSQPNMYSYLKENKMLGQNNSEDLEENTNVLCDMALSVYSIGTLDIQASSMPITFFLTIRWLDPRLSFQGEISEKFIDCTRIRDKIWEPRFWIPNELVGMPFSQTLPSTRMVLRHDGLITYQVGYQVVVYCRQNLNSYPFDVQFCPVTFVSEQVDLRWKTYQIYNPLLPLKYNSDFSKTAVEYTTHKDSNSEYSINYMAYQCNASSLLNLSYSCIETTFKFKRKLKYYYLYGYAPAICIVALCYLQFFIDHKQASPRVAIISACCVSLITHTASLSGLIGSINYLKAIDYYMAACLLFIIFAAYEYAFVHHHVKVHNKRKITRTDDIMCSRYEPCLNLDISLTILGQNQFKQLKGPTYLNQDGDVCNKDKKVLKKMRSYNQINHKKFYIMDSISMPLYFLKILGLRMAPAKKIDRTFAVIYLVFFLGFNVAYFFTYLEERNLYWIKSLKEIQAILKRI